MKKKLVLMLALLLAVSGVSFADIQIDKGQSRSTSDTVFTIVRNGRSNANFGGTGFSNNGNIISKDSVVIWDAVSNDGVSVMLTGTSFDPLVAGILMDDLPGSSRDTTLAQDENQNNWARLQVWGRHADVRWASHMHPNGVALVSGSRVAASAVPGKLGMFRVDTTVTPADGTTNTSRDSIGMLLENSVAGDTTIDVFIKGM